jgi:hypothetical protein
MCGVKFLACLPCGYLAELGRDGVEGWAGYPAGETDDRNGDHPQRLASCGLVFASHTAQQKRESHGRDDGSHGYQNLWGAA